MSDFRAAVLGIVKNIPKGKVMSYGQVAAAAGFARAARQVGGILRGLDASAGQVPWWRVVNNKGVISIKGNWTATKEIQRDLLIKDGVKVSNRFVLNMEQFRYYSK